MAANPENTSCLWESLYGDDGNYKINNVKFRFKLHRATDGSYENQPKFVCLLESQSVIQHSHIKINIMSCWVGGDMREVKPVTDGFMTGMFLWKFA